MIYKFKRKGLIIMVFWLISLISLPIIALGNNKTILVDSKDDLYRFTNEQFNDITNERIADDNMLTIEIMNGVFKDLVNSRNIATKTSNPSKMDLTDLEYDGNKLNIIMNSETIEFEATEVLIGFIWNSESIYIIFLIQDYYLYIDITDLALTDVAIEDFLFIETNDNRLTLDDINNEFDKKNYVKGFFVYTDVNEPDSNTIEMFTTQLIINWSLIWMLFWILIMIILVIIVIIAIIIIANN